MEASQIESTFKQCINQAVREQLLHFDNVDSFETEHWQELIQQLSRSQDQKTIDGIALQIGESAFYNFLYSFDQTLMFSDLSFKLQAFDKKKLQFFEKIVLLLETTHQTVAWDKNHSKITIEYQNQNSQTVKWFLKGFFQASLFWLSNGKQENSRIEESNTSSKNVYQISI